MRQGRPPVQEALVGGYDADTEALGQCEIHEVVDRSVVGDGEPDGVCADGLVSVRPDRVEAADRRTDLFDQRRELMGTGPATSGSDSGGRSCSATTPGTSTATSG